MIVARWYADWWLKQSQDFHLRWRAANVTTWVFLSLYSLASASEAPFLVSAGQDIHYTTGYRLFSCSLRVKLMRGGWPFWAISVCPLSAIDSSSHGDRLLRQLIQAAKSSVKCLSSRSCEIRGGLSLLCQWSQPHRRTFLGSDSELSFYEEKLFPTCIFVKSRDCCVLSYVHRPCMSVTFSQSSWGTLETELRRRLWFCDGNNVPHSRLLVNNCFVWLGRRGLADTEGDWNVSDREKTKTNPRPLFIRTWLGAYWLLESSIATSYQTASA